MIIENLRTNKLSQEVFEWYLKYLKAIDSRDIQTYATFLADDVTVQFNNDDPIRGKENVVGMLSGYWQSFAGLEHDLLNIYGNDNSFVLEAFNHYTRHDGNKVTTRAVAFTDRNSSGTVYSVRIYADVSPVFAE